MKRHIVQKLLPLIVAALIALFAKDYADAPATDDSGAVNWSAVRAGTQVEGSGTVIAVLPDDNDGSRHQRFIIELASGRTLLIAHNIDLAPRIAALELGDTVEFNGVFETNDRGGVIHWTHHDPQGRRQGGWLRHEGRRYE